MKKTTIKRIRRFMAKNNISIADVYIANPPPFYPSVLYEDGFNRELVRIGITLVQGNDFAPQWVHNVLRRMMSLPRWTEEIRKIPWYVLLPLNRLMTGDYPSYVEIKNNPYDSDKDNRM